MARVRSPNYPALSLPAAVERTKTLHKSEGQTAIPREAVAKHLGFGSLNGASATILSALAKYGLLEAAGDGEARVSDLAMRILYPHDGDEKQAALQEAAFRPALFAEIKEKWPDRPPSDEGLRSYLVRNGFSQGALDQVIQFYRDTIEVVGAPGQAHNEAVAPVPKEASMSAGHALHPPAPSPASGKPFSVAFDGSVLTGTINIRSVRDIDRLMRVLGAQKAAFEAMEDNEDPSAEDQRDAVRELNADL